MAEYHVENFGCRANHADGDALGSELDRCGLNRATRVGGADLLVVNTCSVTAEAERTARAFVRRARRENPGVRVVVTGCYAQRAPAEVAGLAGVEAVVGNSHKGRAAAIAAELLGGRGRTGGFVPVAEVRAGSGVRVFADEAFAHAEMDGGGIAGSTDTRPNLKVQDGCGHRCSFCIIPVTRGPSRSVPRATVIERVRRFVEGGGGELVLSGINLGRWGRDFRPAERFEDLVAAILGETRLPRLRLSSVEPMDWTAALLELFREYGREESSGAGPRLARHAHLPLQSGADAVLRGMHRRYRPWHYEEKVGMIREAMPEAGIGADVMVGFPGETEALFEESYGFIERQPFTYLHLFPFSARPGTVAFGLNRERPVAGEAVRERMERLRGLMAEKGRKFRESFVGRELPVITLKTTAEERARGVTRALSDNFVKIELQADLPSNRMLRAHIPLLSEDGLEAVPSPVL